jgi:hypothetical protein
VLVGRRAVDRAGTVIHDILLIVVILVLAGALTVTAQETTQDALDPAGGVLRWGEAPTWQIYDSGHAHTGLAKVRCMSGPGDNGRLVLTFDRPTRYVGFGAVTVDETLASKGVSVGVSGGRAELRLFFFRSGRRLRCDSDLFRDPQSNVWVSWFQADEPAE